MYNLRLYTFDRKQSWVKRVAECFSQYYSELGIVPNVARISIFCKEFPERVGPVTLVRGRGLFEWEMELGVENKGSAQQPKLPSAPPDTTQPL
jgi:hypothetical protein